MFRLLRNKLPTPRNARLLSTEHRSLIQEAVKASPVVLFMKGTPQAPQCGFSRAVVQVLSVQRVLPDHVRAYNCLEDQDLREGIKEFSDWPTIPQLYVDGEFLGGCDIIMESESELFIDPHQHSCFHIFILEPLLTFTSVHKSGELSKMFREKKLVDEEALEKAKTETIA